MYVDVVDRQDVRFFLNRGRWSRVIRRGGVAIAIQI